MLLAAGAIAVGIVAGLLSGAFGIGGGIVMVPLLALGLGLTQHQAQGMTLAVMILPIGLPAVVTYNRMHPIRWRLVGAMVLGFLPGVLAGSLGASALPERPLRVLFVLFLVFVAWRTWSGARPGGAAIRPRAPDGHGLWIGALAGGLAGAFGVGGGLVMIPLLRRFAGQSQHEAQGTSLAVMLPPIGLPGVWVYTRGHGLQLGLIAAVAGGFLGGALVGAHLATRTGSRRLSGAFALLVLAAAAALALRA